MLQKKTKQKVKWAAGEYKEGKRATYFFTCVDAFHHNNKSSQLRKVWFGR